MSLKALPLFLLALAVVFLTPGSRLSANPAQPLRFVPITPCRVVDTRNAPGVLGGPAFQAKETRAIPVATSCGVPTNAAAYAFNVTVVPLGSLDYLSIWAAGKPQPLVSTLNSFDGRIKANAAIVEAGTDGNVAVFVTNATHVILDINGYFMPAGTAGGLAFYPLSPCRVLDTRNAVGPLGGPALSASSRRNFNVQSSSCGIPSTARAYSFNYTVLPRAGSLNYLTTWPADKLQPTVSTLNSPRGEILANAAIVPASLQDGAISVFATDATDLIVDVNGYFAAPGASSLDFFTTDACRVVDTRLVSSTFGGPSLPRGSSRDFAIPQGPCRIPANAAAYSVNATILPVSTLQYLTLWPTGNSRPTVSSLNAYTGGVTSNAAIVPAVDQNASISAFVTDPAQLILDVNGYFAPAPVQEYINSKYRFFYPANFKVASQGVDPRNSMYELVTLKPTDNSPQLLEVRYRSHGSNEVGWRSESQVLSQTFVQSDLGAFYVNWSTKLESSKSGYILTDLFPKIQRVQSDSALGSGVYSRMDFLHIAYTYSTSSGSLMPYNVALRSLMVTTPPSIVGSWVIPGNPLRFDPDGTFTSNESAGTYTANDHTVVISAARSGVVSKKVCEYLVNSGQLWLDCGPGDGLNGGYAIAVY